jgi:tetratricopeptide (TPR) repeat protein
MPKCFHATMQYNFTTFAAAKLIAMRIFLRTLVLTALLFYGCQSSQTPKTGQEPAKTTTTEPAAVPDQKQDEQSQVIMKDQTPRTTGEKNATTLFRRGLELSREEKYTEAIDYFNRALEADPENGRIVFNRGFAYYNLKDYDLAQADFNKVLSKNAADTMAWLYSGLTKYYKADYKGAIQDYTNAIFKSKNFPKPYYNRGIAKGQLKDYKGAVEDFNRAIQLDPDYPDAYFNRGLANFLSRDTLAACRDWREAKTLGSFKAQEAINLYCGGQ